ncbi:MAG: ATP-binding cassette domain-containing protein, partial [Bacteroidota bacterium]
QKVDVSFPIPVSDLVAMGTYVSDEALSRKKVNQLVQHALKIVEMEAFADRTFPSLSGGEQKRVLLAKCITQLNCCHWADLPKYLFLDEPTASLDVQQQYKLMEMVKQWIRRRHIGVFAVLHDLNLAAQFADEILLLQAGRLVKKGSPKEVLTIDTLKQVMGIEALVQPHPIHDCPLITPIGHAAENRRQVNYQTQL